MAISIARSSSRTAVPRKSSRMCRRPTRDVSASSGTPSTSMLRPDIMSHRSRLPTVSSTPPGVSSVSKACTATASAATPPVIATSLVAPRNVVSLRPWPSLRRAT